MGQNNPIIKNFISQRLKRLHEKQKWALVLRNPFNLLSVEHLLDYSVGFTACNFTVLVHSPCSHSVIYCSSRQLFFTKEEKKKKPYAHYLPINKPQTDKFSN